jgi:uncharacterized membrane protein HdeD (DUF308 family)
MDNIRIWGMRIAGAILLAFGLLAFLAAAESHSLSFYLTREALDRRVLAAIVLPLLFIATGVIAVVASSRRFAESKQLRIGAALLIVLSLVLFAVGHVFELGA